MSRSRLWFTLRVVGFAATVPLLVCRPVDCWTRYLAARPRGAPPSADEIDRLVTEIDRALRRGWPLVRSGCLTRGVTMYRFLARAGAPVSLHLGAGMIANRFAAHCWVEHAGEPLREPRDPRPIFTSMHVVPPPRAPGTA